MNRQHGHPFTTLGFNPHNVDFFKINLCRSAVGGKELTSWSEAKNQFDEVAAMGYASVLAPAELAAKLAVGAKPATVAPADAVRLWTPKPFQRVYSDTFPDSDTPPLSTLNIVAGRNDSEAAQVLITNFSEDNLYFRVEPQFLLSDGATRFSELLTIGKIHGVLPAKSCFRCCLSRNQAHPGSAVPGNPNALVRGQNSSAAGQILLVLPVDAGQCRCA